MHEVRVRDRVVLLTATEYWLPEELVRHAGRPLLHAYLLPLYLSWTIVLIVLMSFP